MARVRISIVLALVFSLLAVGAVVADTVEPTDPYDETMATAWFLWTDSTSGIEYEAQVSVGVDELTDTPKASMIFARVIEEESCNNWSFFRVEAAASGAGVAFAGRNNLASASGSGTVSGAEIMRDGCDVETVGPLRTFDVSIDLTATSRVSRDQFRSVDELEDGTKITRHYRSTFAQAVGMVSVDGVTYQLLDASISNQSLAVRIR
jgi:hypothetical protein